MLTFRVEHRETGEGPYNGPEWDGQNEMRFVHSGGDHPSPMRDTKLRRRMSWAHRCACDSPASLLAWFDGFWEELDESGEYDVVIHEVRTKTVGDYGQVVYHADTAREVSSYTPAEFARHAA